MLELYSRTMERTNKASGGRPRSGPEGAVGRASGGATPAGRNSMQSEPRSHSAWDVGAGGWFMEMQGNSVMLRS